MSEGKEERAAGVMDENTKDEGKEDLAREEDGGNILDDILNTKEEKFEDEDMVKKDEEEDDQTSLKWYSTIAVLSGTLAPAHCVTGAVSTHDVMYTGFYF